MKHIGILLLFVLFSCGNNQRASEKVAEYIQNKHNITINEADKLLFFRIPSCGPCNKKMLSYITSQSYKVNHKLIFNCAYPDTATLSKLSKKFGNNLILERSDSICSLLNDIQTSGSICFDKNGNIIFNNFTTETDPVIFFSEKGIIDIF